MRKYRDNIKVDTTPVEKKEIDKVLAPINNVCPRDHKLVWYPHYARFNAPTLSILEEALQADLIPPLRKFNNLPNNDQIL